MELFDDFGDKLFNDLRVTMCAIDIASGNAPSAGKLALKHMQYQTEDYPLVPYGGGSQQQPQAVKQSLLKHLIGLIRRFMAWVSDKIDAIVLKARRSGLTFKINKVLAFTASVALGTDIRANPRKSTVMFPYIQLLADRNGKIDPQYASDSFKSLALLQSNVARLRKHSLARLTKDSTKRTHQAFVNYCDGLVKVCEYTKTQGNKTQIYLNKMSGDTYIIQHPNATNIKSCAPTENLQYTKLSLERQDLVLPYPLYSSIMYNTGLGLFRAHAKMVDILLSDLQLLLPELNNNTHSLALLLEKLPELEDTLYPVLFAMRTAYGLTINLAGEAVTQFGAYTNYMLQCQAALTESAA